MAEISAEDSHSNLFLDALDDPLSAVSTEVTGDGVGSPTPADEFFDSRPDPSYRPSQRNLRRRFPSRRIEFQRLSCGDGSDGSSVDEAGGTVVDGGNDIPNLRISEPSSSRVDSSSVTGLSEGPLVSEVFVVPASNGDDFRTRKESDCDKSGQDHELHELSMVSSGCKEWLEGGNGDGGETPGPSPLKIESSEMLKDSGFSKTIGSHGISPVSSLVTEQIEAGGGRNFCTPDKNEEPITESHVNADYTNRLELVECSGEELSGSSLDVAQGLPPSNFLISLSGFVIKLIGFQINLFVMFLVFPIRSSYYMYKLVTDPFGTVYQIKGLGVNVLGKVSNYVWERIGANFVGQTAIKKILKMFGWGCLWSSYVGFLLFSFFMLSFILSGVLMGNFLEKPIRMTKPLSFDYTVTDPEALVPINAFEGIDYRQYCKNVNAEKSEGRRFIPPYHKLQLTISLTLPESEYNRKLGVFQVTVDFLSANGEVLASSGHPCMLCFKSDQILLVGTLLKGVPLLAGYSSESQTIKVRMTGFVEGIEPSTCLKVTLKHRAEWGPGEGIPEIYSASILLESELPMPKRILWSWRRTIFVWVAAGFFVMELLLILICRGHIIFPRPRPTPDVINLRQDSFQSIDRL